MRVLTLTPDMNITFIMDQVRKRLIDRLVIRKIDDLFESLSQFSGLVDELKEKGVTLEVSQLKCDTSNSYQTAYILLAANFLEAGFTLIERPRSSDKI